MFRQSITEMLNTEIPFSIFRSTANDSKRCDSQGGLPAVIPGGGWVKAKNYLLTRFISKHFLISSDQGSCEHGPVRMKLKYPFHAEGGILALRREGDSNTHDTLLGYTRFPGGPVKPLLHLSPKIEAQFTNFFHPATSNQNLAKTPFRGRGLKL